jgi:hypothetical protein
MGSSTLPDWMIGAGTQALSDCSLNAPDYYTPADRELAEAVLIGARVPEMLARIALADRLAEALSQYNHLLLVGHPMVEVSWAEVDEALAAYLASKEEQR